MRPHLLLAFMAPAVLAAQAPAVGMVVDVKGGATFTGGGKAAPVRLLDPVPAARKVLLAAGARLVVVVVKGGTRLTFTGPGTFTLDPEGRPSGLKAASRDVPALKLKHAVNPGELAQASLTMREAPKAWEPRLRRPAGAAVREERPLLAWEPHPVSATYTFVLRDARGRTVVSAEQPSPQVSLPDGTRLVRGARYDWWIRAVDGQGLATAATGSFTVLDQEACAVLEAARPGPEAEFADRLLYATLLVHFGLEDEARAALAALRAERPGDPGLKKLGGWP